MLKSRIVLTSLAVIGFLAASAGGGWVKSKGTGYYKLGQNWVSASGYLSSPNTFSSRLNTDLYTTSFYTEHGLGKRFSAELYLPFYVRHSISGTVVEEGNSILVEDALGGFGDVNLGFRYGWVESSGLAISSTLTLGLPTGKLGGGDREVLFTGDAEANQILRTDLSVPFGNKVIAGYSTIYGARNFRSFPFNDEWHYGAEVGISHTKSRVWLIGRYQAIRAQEADGPREIGTSFTQSMSFTNYMVEVAYGLDEHLGISANYTGSIDGNLLLVAPVYGFGIYWNIN